MAKTVGPSGLIEAWADSGLVVEPSVEKIGAGWTLAEKPPHEYMNWLQNTYAVKLNHLMQHGIPRWSADTTYGVGDFVSEGGSIYKATAPAPAAAPPSAGWAVVGETAGVVPEGRTLTAAGLVTGGGDLSADRTFTVTEATQAEAEAATNSTRAMTPRRTAQAIAALAMRRLIVSHTLAAGVAPPAAVAGTQTRPLNTIDINTITGASLSANQIVLPVGVYDVDGFAVGGDGAGLRHQAWLQNITEGITEIAGSNAFVGGDGSDGSTETRVMGQLTVVGAPKTYQLIHWFQAARAKGMGYENGNANLTPGVFARLRFTKIA